VESGKWETGTETETATGTGSKEVWLLATPVIVFAALVRA